MYILCGLFISFLLAFPTCAIKMINFKLDKECMSSSRLLCFIQITWIKDIKSSVGMNESRQSRSVSVSPVMDCGLISLPPGLSSACFDELLLLMTLIGLIGLRQLVMNFVITGLKQTKSFTSLHVVAATNSFGSR